MTPAATIHGEITADGKQIVLIGAGPPDWLAYLAKWLQLATPLIKKSDPPGALVLPATWAAAVQLANLLGKAWRPGPRLSQWITDEVLLRAMRHQHELSYQVPAGLTPRPYQIEGALMIAALGGGLLFDDPGTGKTITTILGLMERAIDVFPVVCVVPASVVDPWVAAWQAWAPSVRAVAWRGVPKKRHALAKTADVYVASYDTARMDAPPGSSPGPLQKLKARSVVIDECHLIKSQYAMRSLAARRLAKKANHVVALSGTPITHDSSDLWPTLEALEPRAFPSKERYVNRYCASVEGDYNSETLGLNPETEPEFRTVLMGQYRRVAKPDVLEQLPPKVYSVRYVELPAEWRKAYDQLEDQMLAELPDGQELSVMSVLAQLNHLSQLASAAADVEITTTFDEVTGIEKQSVHLELKAPSWKVDELLAVLAERPGSPVVSFAPSKQLMMLAGAAAVKAGLQVGYVVGNQSMKERTQTVEHFQAGKLDLLCATTGAGGVGLTLTAARTVTFLQRPWSLVEALQAEDRCHRIGSEIHDSIEIIDIVATNTLDTRVRSVLRDKAGQLADLLQDQRIVTELLGGKRK